MSYNEQLLKEFIRNTINERITTDAGKSVEDSTPGAPGFTSFSDRWGAYTALEKQVRATGLAGMLGMAQSTVDWPRAMKKFFTAWFDLATYAGKKVIELLEKVVNPSPGSKKNWSFPRAQKFIDKVTGKGAGGRASWGSSLAKAKPRSATSVSGGSVFSGGKKVTESLVLEATGDEQFLVALAGDLSDIVSLATNLKSGLNLIQVVTEWVKNVETEGDISQLVAAIKDVPEGDLDVGDLTSGLIDELLIPYIKSVLADLPKALSDMGVPADVLEESAAMISAAIAKI